MTIHRKKAADTTATDEQVMVLDAFGQPTAEVVTKQGAHARNLLHAGAQVWIYNQRSEVLLQLRAASVRMYPNTWDVAATGHVLAGETPLQGALRETYEELGLRLRPTELKFIGTVRVDQPVPGSGIHHTFETVYIVRKDVDPQQLTLQAAETAAVHWFPLDTFERDVRDPKQLAIHYSMRPGFLFTMVIAAIRADLATIAPVT